MTDILQNFPADPEGDARAMASIVVELEAAIANVKAGVTTAVALVEVQMASGKNLVNMISGPRENEALLQGLRDAWERVAVRCIGGRAQAIVGPLVVWLPDEGEEEGTLQ